MMKADTSNQHSTVKVNVPIQFKSWNNQLLHATLTSIAFQADEHETHASLNITISASTMQQLIDGQWFHAWPHALTAQAHYDKLTSIEVSLELNPAIASLLAEQRKDAEFILAALLPPSTLEDSAYAGTLAHSDCWFLLEAIQTVKLPPSLKKEGTLRQGIRTIWHPSLSAAMQRQPSIIQEDNPVKLSVMQQLEAALIRQQLNYDIFEKQIFRVPFHSEATGRWLLLLQPDTVLQAVTVHSMFPIPIPSGKQERLALYLLRMQSEFTSGCFELDPEEEQLRFRSVIECPNKELPVNKLQSIIGNHMTLMEQYIPVIEKILED
ncbi:hypothetical protein [Paenibacillus sp. IITD108]|uniref:hypothetical protein n=1 Tax=Paenibacillus sp. IITD108 TaxID=3116649 RepID=UPI002F3FF58C